MIPEQHTIIEYAIRYCITRSSYAFVDGLDLAEQHWDALASSTKRDVGDAFRHDDAYRSVDRWPKIAEYAGVRRG